jgi:V/A-type H+/Na+-transporting ATPase subunit C
MKAPSLIYVTTRTHGLSRRLIKPAEIKIIQNAKDLNEIVGLIPKDEYPEVTKIQIIDTSNLEKIFLAKMVKRFYFVVNLTTKNLQEFFQGYSSKFEMENVKAILRAKHRGEPVDEEDLIPLLKEFTLVNFQALIKAKNIEDFVKLLKETDYNHLSNDLGLYEKYKTPIVLEALLDRHYYERLFNISKNIMDTKIVNQFLGVEVDLKNIMHIFFLKIQNIEFQQIQDMIIPQFYKIGKRTIDMLIESKIEDFENILKNTHYAKFIIEIESARNKGSIGEIEKIFSTWIYEEASEIAVRSPFTLGYVLYYLVLCEKEARNLISSIMNKQFK